MCPSSGLCGGILDCDSQFTILSPPSFDKPQLWRSTSVCSSLYLLTRAHCVQCSVLLHTRRSCFQHENCPESSPSPEKVGIFHHFRPLRNHSDGQSWHTTSFSQKKHQSLNSAVDRAKRRIGPRVRDREEKQASLFFVFDIPGAFTIRDEKLQAVIGDRWNSCLAGDCIRVSYHMFLI